MELAPGFTIEDAGDQFYLMLETPDADLTFAVSIDAAEKLGEFLGKRFPRHGISR